MAVAALDLLARTDEIGNNLVMSTTNPPYFDKSVGATVHASVGGSRNLRVSDMHGLRSGATGLWHALQGGGTVVAGEVRMAAPGSQDELLNGDAAAAITCDSSKVAARLIASSSITEEVLDRWRLSTDEYGTNWDERFTMEILGDAIKSVAEEVMRLAGLDRVDTVVVACPNARAAQMARKQLGGSGADAETESSLGHTGAAHVLLLFADALDRAAPGDTILVVNASDGADAFIFEATNDIGSARRSPTVREQIEAMTPITYERFLRWRGVLDFRGPNRPEPDAPASPPMFRRASWKYALTGVRCEKCGTVTAPPSRVCPSCAEVDSGVAVSLRDKPATVVTMTVDWLSPTPSPPVVLAIVDVDGGGRRSAETADLKEEGLEIGDRVVPTFRLINSGGGIRNYFWKVRPLRPWEVGL